MSQQQQQQVQEEGKTVNEIYRQTQEEFKNIRNNCKRNADPILQRNEKYVTTPLYLHIPLYTYSQMFQNQKLKQRIIIP